MLNAIGSKFSRSKDGAWKENRDEAGKEHIEFDEDDFECVPCEAGGTVAPKRHFGDPIAEENHEHNSTQCPYRSWCFVRVEAQGMEDHHHRATEEDFLNEAPGVSMDYEEMSEYGCQKAQVTKIICRDAWTKSVASHVAKAGGSIECAKELVEFFDSFGYGEIVLKSDNE